MDELHLAHAWGTRALWVWAVGTVLAGSGAWGVWSLWRVGHARLDPLPDPERGVPLWILACRMALALACVAAAGAGFAELAEHIGSAGQARRLGRIDEAVIAGVREGLGPVALRVMAALSHLGDVITLTVLTGVVAAVLWRRGRTGLACGWVLAVAGNGVLIRVLKGLFERARPEHFHELAVVSSYSFPSGHASGSMVAYGWCAYLALRWLSPRWHSPAVVAAAVGVWTIGCSRVLVQVHFPSDVWAGWLSGGAWLVASIAAVEGLRHHRRWTRSSGGRGLSG